MALVKGTSNTAGIPPSATAVNPGLVVDGSRIIPAPSSVWEKKDASMKLGGEMHDAAEITAALIMAHGLKTPEALKTFDEILRGIIQVREKLV